jgi:hypothetical protein
MSIGPKPLSEWIPGPRQVARPGMTAEGWSRIALRFIRARLIIEQKNPGIAAGVFALL